MDFRQSGQGGIGTGLPIWFHAQDMDGHMCISDAVVDHQKHTILFQLAICRAVCCTVSGSALFAVQFQGVDCFLGPFGRFSMF